MGEFEIEGHSHGGTGTRRGATGGCVTVADARSLSYYSDASLTARLPLDRRALLDARQALISADLIAFEPPLYQVLSLRRLRPPSPLQDRPVQRRRRARDPTDDAP